MKISPKLFATVFAALLAASAVQGVAKGIACSGLANSFIWQISYLLPSSVISDLSPACD